MLRLIGILAAAAIAGAASAQSVPKSSSSSTTSLSTSGGTTEVKVNGVVVDSRTFPAGTKKVTVRTRTATGQAPEVTIIAE